MHTSRLPIIFLAVTLLLLILGACGNNGQSTPPPTESPVTLDAPTPTNMATMPEQPTPTPIPPDVPVPVTLIPGPEVVVSDVVEWEFKSPAPLVLKDVSSTGLLFLLDSSESIALYCDEHEVTKTLYQIPELFTSFMAVYEKEMGGAYVGPHVNYYVYPSNEINSSGDSPANYNSLRYTLPLTLTPYLDNAWYLTLEQRLVRRVSAYGHGAVLNAATDFVKNANLERFVIVLITDGMVEYVPNGTRTIAEEKRKEIEDQLKELTQLDAVEVEVIVLQLDGCLADNTAEEDAYQRDLRLWKSLDQDGTLTLLQHNSVVEFVQGLLLVDSFSTLLPEQDNGNQHWRLMQEPGGTNSDMRNILTFTVDDWFLDKFYLIAPEILKTDGNTNYKLEGISPGGSSNILDTSLSNIAFELDGTPVSIELPDCNVESHWRVIPPYGKENELAIYFWQTSFPLNNISILGSESETLNIRNLEELSLSTQLFEPNPKVNEHANRGCFYAQMFLRDADENKLGSSLQEVQLNSLTFNMTWDFIPIQATAGFLGYGPQQLEAVFQIGRYNTQSDEKIAVAEVTVGIEASFEPAPVSNAIGICNSETGCELELPVQFLATDFYSASEREVTVWGLTQKSKDNPLFDTPGCSAGYSSQNVEGGIVQYVGYLVPDDKVDIENENIIRVTFPSVWHLTDCGFEIFLMRLQYDAGATEFQLVCRLETNTSVEAAQVDLICERVEHVYAILEGQP